MRKRDEGKQLVVRNNVVSSSSTRHIRDLPGPWNLPLLGNALRIRLESMHQTLEQWNREYGDVFRFRMPRREFVVISNPETIATVLRDRPDGFKRSRRLEETTRELGFGGVFSANGEPWKRQRRMVQHGLDPTHVKAFFPTLVKVTQRFALRWHRAAVANETIDLLSDLMRYTVDVTAGLAFGADINTIESDQEVIQTHLDKLFPMLFKRLLAPVRYWHYLKLPSDRRAERHLSAVQRAVDGFIRAARLRLEQHPELRERPSNLIEAMIAARDSPDSQVTDEEVAGNVLTMLLAGEDTTANTLSWAVWFLHRNRDAIKQAKVETLRVLGDDAFPSHHEQLNQLHSIEACINETMRLKPAAPFVVAEAVRDVVIENLELPAGAIVICLMRPAALDERRFADARTFRLERWLAGAGAFEVDNSVKRVLMPFGAGPRLCPGRYLALAEMKMVIAMVLQGFEIEAVTTPDAGEPRERMAFTMSPVGLKLRLREREIPIREVLREPRRADS
jgi:cytochrome P450